MAIIAILFNVIIIGLNQFHKKIPFSDQYRLWSVFAIGVPVGLFGGY